MIDFLSQTWAWYVSGPLIAGVMFLLLWAGGQFGVSGNLRTLCTLGGAGRAAEFFRFDWRAQRWNLVFVAGAIIGGWLAITFLENPEGIVVSEQTVTDLRELGISYDRELAPRRIFSWDALTTPMGLFTMVLGGFLVGFGTRWAGGCTSGHAISGLSNLQLPSLIAVIGFFLGGLLMTHLLFPILFNALFV